MEGGERLGYVNGFTLDGNGKRGYHDDSHDAQAVLLRRDCYVKLGADLLIQDWARCGILAFQGSTIFIEGSPTSYVEIKNCGSDGVVASAGSNVYARFVRVSGCAGNGFHADMQGFIYAMDTHSINNVGTNSARFRGGIGYTAVWGSTIRADNAVSTGNASSGMFANQNSTISADGVTISGNGTNANAGHRYGIVARFGSTLYFNDAAVTDNASTGIFVGSGSTAYGARVACTGNGAAVSGNAGIWVTESGSYTGSAVNGSLNTGCGLKADKGASVTCIQSIFNENTADGVNAQQAQVWLGNTPGTASTVKDNGGWGVIARISATVQLSGGAANIAGNALGQLSPAANTSGLSNSYIHG